MDDLLRIVTCGSVDDGKSTLMGHLLYDAKLIFSDQEKALEIESKVKNADGAIDYSLLLDGLSAEREQGITIDVSYRFFATRKRIFIVADCPGHAEYTRNMAVGASASDVAILLIDGTKGIQPQTKRHFRISKLMGIRDFVFAVNKMDVVDYDEMSFLKIKEAIKKDIIRLQGEDEQTGQKQGLDSLYVIPVSALEGENLTCGSKKMPWHKGPFLLEYLESIRVGQTHEEGFVMAVQRVTHDANSKRYYQGQVSSGEIGVGDVIKIYPGNNESEVTSILVGGESRAGVKVGEATSIAIKDELDISRGYVLAKDTEVNCSNLLEGDVLWLDDNKLKEGRSYIMKLATQTRNVSVMKIKYQIDIDTGKHIANRELEKNQLARVDIASSEPLVFDSFDNHREMGRFILIDRITNATVACGTVCFPLRRGSNLIWQSTDVTREERSKMLNQNPKTIWLTGLSGSGKSTVANALEKELVSLGLHTMLLDGDNVRLGINKDLGFKDYDRTEHIRRVAEIAKLMNDGGIIVIAALISPFQEDREMAKKIIGEKSYIEVYVSTPLEECEARDSKGLYKKARNGEIPNFTGVSSPYEIPNNPNIEINAGEVSVEDAVNTIVETILPSLKIPF